MPPHAAGHHVCCCAQEERRKMTVRIFVRRWRSHGLYKVLSAWKRYTRDSKRRKKSKLVERAQEEVRVLQLQLEDARTAHSREGISDAEKSVRGPCVRACVCPCAHGIAHAVSGVRLCRSPRLRWLH